jgi:tRNA-2-methylthio-N6-dimethylallyladenosine synthase
MNMDLKYHIWTIGCQMNEADSRHLGSQLESLGYSVTEKADEADLLVMNTCVVRQQAEDKAVHRLDAVKGMKRRRPNITVALMGCMVGMREAPQLKERFPFVDVFMPPSETAPLLDYLDEQKLYDPSRLFETRERAVRDAVQDGEYILPALQRDASVTAHVPVVLGCSHACTFCVIPYRRGAERSRPRDEVLREVRALVGQGVKEVMLLGQIVDRYGLDFDQPYDLADLLREVAGVDGLERLRFLTSHPNWITDKLIDAVAGMDKVCPQIEIPFQAGSDTVLERMRRGYTRAQYRAVVERIRRRLPDAAVHTDVIVGFCGESEAEFMETYELVKELRFDKIHLAKYSVRPKTIAARQMPDDVPPEEKERRRLMLEELQESILREKNSALLGRTVEVLVENRQKGRWRGRSPEGKLVFFDLDRERRGQLVDVVIEHTGPYSLVGTPADVAVSVG